MDFDRRSGLFLHVSSLPSLDGIGTLGEPAREFVDFLDASGQSLWQFCPLGPTKRSCHDSPYQSYSAFAGNPLFVDLDELAERGWLDDFDRPDFDRERVEYARVREFKRPLLRDAFETFRTEATDDERAAFERFCEDAAWWLDDYALFRAIHERIDADSWLDWPRDVRTRDPDALATYREELADEISYRQFVQWTFDRQWTALREYANARGVELVGDVPIYVGRDSADVWSEPEIFELDDDHELEYVSGFPPDGFSDDGQMWDTPVYDWDALADREYDWWVGRFERTLQRFDRFRLDHFKGFESYWAIPAEADTAKEGEWVEGPREDLFYAVCEELGTLPILVENIGVISDEMERMRTELGYPTMNIAVFADWCDRENRYHPASYGEHSVAYTTTHDTNTVVGRYGELDDEQRDCLEAFVGHDGEEIHWDVVDAVWESDSALAIAQVQDVLGLDADARFNFPGTVEDNWTWRVTRNALDDDVARRLYEATERSDRLTE